MTSPTETTPLTSEELKRLDELALERVASGQDGPCPECNLEPDLVVRLVEEVRELRRWKEESEQAGMDRNLIT